MGLKLWTSSTKRTRTTCPCEAALYEGLLACQEACLLCIISCKYCAWPHVRVGMRYVRWTLLQVCPV